LVEKRNRLGTRYFVNTDDEIVSKECKKCSKVKLISDFHTSKKGLAGKQSECKECHAIHHFSNHEENLAKKREWYSENKEERLLKNKDWVDRNKQQVVEYKKRWFEQNKEDIARRFKKNYKLHRGEILEKRRLDRKENPQKHRAWELTNPDRIIVKSHRRRARKLSLPSEWSVDDQRQTLEVFGGCALTGDKDIQWDHVIPIASEHGGTIPANMIPLRKDLNASKSSRNVFEWFEADCDRFNLDPEKFNQMVLYLAGLNGMTTEEYRNYVYKCFEK
jgi:hypothetical protein